MSATLVSVLILASLATGCTLKDTLEPPVPAEPVVFQPPPPAAPPPVLAPFRQEPVTSQPQLVPPKDDVATVKPRPKGRPGASPVAEYLVDPLRTSRPSVVQRYAWDDGKVYRVFTALHKPTALFLPPGETLAAPAVLADPKAWEVGGTQTTQGDVVADVLLLRPVQPQPASLMTLILTSGKTIFVQLEVYKTTQMVAVTWDMATPATDGLQADANTALAQVGFGPLRPPAAGKAPVPASPASLGMAPPVPQIDLTRLHTVYTIIATHGKPAWQPIAAYDDGTKTVLRFAGSLAGLPAPAVFGVHSTGTLGVVESMPYSLPDDPQKGTYYLVQGIWPKLELRGTDGQTVTITRGGLPVPPYHPRVGAAARMKE